MDYLVFRAFVESVKNGTGVPIDIYDAAAWMAVTCLSEESIALGGAPGGHPGFHRRPLDPRRQLLHRPLRPAGHSRHSRRITVENVLENNRRADCAVQSVRLLFCCSAGHRMASKLSAWRYSSPSRPASRMPPQCKPEKICRRDPGTAANFLLRSGGECCIMCEHRMHMPV